MAISGALGIAFNPRSGALYLVMGIALVVVGGGAFFLFRWMAKRGA
ncbi:hypothetical protein [Leifsonia sp. fls2-241-R2A-40a]|nr:hypothetical protein [Leifsonia sp. fls2-241-R2A-40a]